MKLRTATAADVDFIFALEQRRDLAPYVNRWRREEHLEKLAQADWRYLISEHADGSSAGYAILRGITSPHHGIELTRIVMAQPGQGGGRATCKLIFELVFGTLGAHRLQLDVIEDNVRAARLYESLGFRREGVLREAFLLDGRYRSLVLMGLLEEEYRLGAGH